MERIHMHYFKDIIYRLQRGESERQIARDLCIIRGKSSINSGGNRPPIPADIVHSFRSKPSTFS